MTLFSETLEKLDQVNGAFTSRRYLVSGSLVVERTNHLPAVAADRVYVVVEQRSGALVLVQDFGREPTRIYFMAEQLEYATSAQREQLANMLANRAASDYRIAMAKSDALDEALR